MVTFRAIASLTKRSDSWRMASLDIGNRGLRIVSSITRDLAVFPFTGDVWHVAGIARAKTKRRAVARYLLR
jgi:hypothetical protein